MKKLVFILIVLIQVSEADSRYSWLWEDYHLFNVMYTCRHLSSTDSVSTLPAADLYTQIPLIRKDSLYIATGTLFRSYAPQPYRQTENTQAALIGAVDVRISSQWHLYAEYNGGITGDFSRARQNQSHLLFTFAGYNLQRNTYIRGGAGLLHEFNKETIFPIIGISHAFSDKNAVEVLIPKYLMYRRRFDDKTEGGLKCSLREVTLPVTDSGTYSLRIPETTVFMERTLRTPLILRLQGGVFLPPHVRVSHSNLSHTGEWGWLFRISFRWAV
ncbi:MAG: hypothetical protein ACQEQV_07235 [Fibrobacterota bacterium]